MAHASNQSKDSMFEAAITIHLFSTKCSLFPTQQQAISFEKSKTKKNTDGSNRSAVHVTEVLILVFIAVNRVTYPK